MGERRDLRDLLRDTDFTQKRIIDDLASSDTDTEVSDRGVAGDIRKSEGGDLIKNIFVGLLLVGIVVGSFWVSFLIGKKVLVPPVKNLPTFETNAPKAISKTDIEQATPVKEDQMAEEPVQEKEITSAPAAVQSKAGLPKPVSKKKLIAASTVSKKATPMVFAKPRTITAIKSAAKKMAYYKVIVGSFGTAGEANALSASLREKGFTSYIKKLSGSFRVQAGAFDASEKAVPMVVKLKANGFSPTIIKE